MSQQVGFIGLGIMGSRMAANLQNAGHSLVVFNRTRSKADPLIEMGAIWSNTPAQLAEKTKVLFTMLSTPEAVKETALGPDGFLDHLPPNAIWVDSSTVNPSFARAMAAEAQKRNIRHIDAPVIGTKMPAQEGQLQFFAGGDEADIESVKPYFEIMGSAVKHIGEHGMGASLKMVLNLLLAQNMLIFSEAAALGRSLGFSQQVLFDTLLGGLMAAPVLSKKRAKIEEGIYEADFPLQWMHKDLHLASVTAYENGVALPVGNVTKEIFALAKKEGLGEKDFAAIYDFIGTKS